MISGSGWNISGSSVVVVVEVVVVVVVGRGKFAYLFNSCCCLRAIAASTASIDIFPALAISAILAFISSLLNFSVVSSPYPVMEL